MIRTRVQVKDGVKPIVLLCLTEEDMEGMGEYSPAVVDSSAFGLDRHVTVVALEKDSGMINFPVGLEEKLSKLGVSYKAVSFSVDDVMSLVEGNVATLEDDSMPCDYHVLYREDKDALIETIKAMKFALYPKDEERIEESMLFLREVLEDALK